MNHGEHAFSLDKEKLALARESKLFFFEKFVDSSFWGSVAWLARGEPQQCVAAQVDSKVEAVDRSNVHALAGLLHLASSSQDSSSKEHELIKAALYCQRYGKEDGFKLEAINGKPQLKKIGILIDHMCNRQRPFHHEFELMEVWGCNSVGYDEARRCVPPTSPAVRVWGETDS
eukprot:1626718-Rhodomonas_salina.1